MKRVTTLYQFARSSIAGFTAAFLLILLASTPGRGMTDVYQLSQSTGSPMDMSGSTQLISSYYSRQATSPRSIGFTFKFDGRDYTTFSANSSGAFSLGTTTQRYDYPRYYPNYPYTWSSYYLGNKLPFLAVYWLYRGYPTGGGKVHYKLSGTAPDRVLTIEWKEVYTYGGYRDYYPGGTFQARLYEGTNKIEYYYDVMGGRYSYRSAIGMISSSTRWINVWGNDINEHRVAPQGGYYNYRYANSYPMTRNRVFTFNPCEKSVTLTGDVGNGGTLEMKEGDELISDMTTQRGSSESFYPFAIDVPTNGCEAVSYSATFSGEAAADYQVVPGTIDLGRSGSPEIVFTPQAVGERKATMTLRLDNGETFTYDLVATGLTRIDWLADVGEGGIAGMPSGGTLLSNIDVRRNDSRDLMPFTLNNINPDPSQFQADITYVLDDPLDEYSLAVPNGTVTGGATQQTGMITIGQGGASTPVITFSPHPDGTEYGTGPQEATLTVIADGEERIFSLEAFAVAPALAIDIEGVDVITSDRNFFRNTVTCVGEQATVLELMLTNTNRVDVELDELGIYAVDPRVQQGAPKYPHQLDNFGNLVRSDDYVLSMAPGVAPASDNPQVRFPLTIGPGESRTYYLTYVGQRPGKRYARAFLRTNAVNFFAPDMNNFTPGETPTPDVEGLMTIEFYGRALGSTLASSADGAGADGLSLTFDPVKVGESIEAETIVYNTGECDLRINSDQAHLTTGDVDEFELLEVFGGATMDGQDYVIAPGASATLKARFTPSRSGSRRASVLLQTNDSLVGVEGVTSPGVYYLNLYGVGKADLRAYGVSLDPAVLEGPGSQGVVRLVNTSSEVVEVTGALLEGANISEITEDPAMPWPALPAQIGPGDELEFGVALNAASGSEPGVRTAAIAFSYGEGESVRAPIDGLVGTRRLTATPATLFDDVEMPVGSISRRTVVLSNTGTFPVSLEGLRIEGPGGAEYEAMSSGRTVVDAGGFEFIEVTYAPTVPGSQEATLVIENNGIDGPISIALSGTSMGVHSGGSGMPTGTRPGAPDRPAERRGVGSGELELTATPNPVRGSALLRMTFPVDGPATLQVYRLDGRPVATLLSEGVDAGDREIRLDGMKLAAGSYMLRLEQGGSIVTRAITVVR